MILRESYAGQRMGLRDWSGATLGLALLWKLWDVGLYHLTDPRFVQSRWHLLISDHCTLWSNIFSKYFIQEDPKKGDYYGGAKPDKIIFRYGSRNDCGQVQQKLSKNNTLIVWIVYWESRWLHCVLLFRWMRFKLRCRKMSGRTRC